MVHLFKTSTGFKAVNPEGYVAIDHEGKAVKLVDRMEFSQNNFNAAKTGINSIMELKSFREIT